MFEHVFVTNTGRTVRPYTVMVSFAGQMALVGLGILVPLLYTDALPDGWWAQHFSAPLVPPGRPAVQPPPKTTSSVTRARPGNATARLFEPLKYPPKARTIVDEEAPPAAWTDGGPGGVVGSPAGPEMGPEPGDPRRHPPDSDSPSHCQTSPESGGAGGNHTGQSRRLGEGASAPADAATRLSGVGQTSADRRRGPLGGHHRNQRDSPGRSAHSGASAAGGSRYRRRPGVALHAAHAERRPCRDGNVRGRHFQDGPVSSSPWMSIPPRRRARSSSASAIASISTRSAWSCMPPPAWSLSASWWPPKNGSSST